MDEHDDRRGLTGEAREALERALERLGCEVARWRGGLASVRLKGERFHVSAETIAAMLDRPLDAAGPDELVLLVAEVLGLPMEDSLLESIDPVRPLLRPRIVGPGELEGPNRTMCRRPLWGDLVAGVTVGSGVRRRFVTTRQLDSWGLEFEEVLLLAKENLKRVINTSHLHDVDGVAGMLAVVHDGEPAAAAALILEDLMPGIDARPGIVFSMPGEETLLLLPLEMGEGAAGLAGMVQATYALAAEREEPLSERVFWRRGGEVVVIPMTWVEEEGSRRVHLEAEGVVAELLRDLGEVE